MAMKIKNVTHGKRNYNSFCGPGAISAITGITAEKAAKLIADHRGISPKRQAAFAKNARRTGRGHGIKGTHNHEMEAVLRGLGYRAQRVVNYGKSESDRTIYDPTVAPQGLVEGSYVPTLKQWDAHRRRTTDLYLVVLSTHFIVVQGDKIVDNQLETVRTLSEAKHYNRARVRVVYRIEKA